MKKTALILTVILALFLQGYANSYERAIVESILEKNDLNWNIDERITIEGNRIVALDLDNKDISNPGIYQLPAGIGNLTELRILTLNDNDLTRLPEELFNAKKLVKLEVKNNNLLVLPKGLKALKRLQELDLRNNELVELPSQVGHLKSLVKLQLWGNELSKIPEEIGYLSSLRELYLTNNHLVSLPESITNLKLSYFDVYFNYLDNNSKRVDTWLKKYNSKYENEQFDSYEGKLFL